MARPVKWSRDLHSIRDRATRSRTETWSRQDIEQLFNVGRASAQLLLRAIGGVATVAGAHFVDRAAVVEFLDTMILAPSVEAALQERLAAADPPPRRTPLRTSLPAELRQAMLEDLPPNVTLSTGRLEITAPTAVAMLESLVTLALIMQNDLERFRAAAGGVTGTFCRGQTGTQRPVPPASWSRRPGSAKGQKPMNNRAKHRSDGELRWTNRSSTLGIR